jgi:hypothetical protein
MYTEIEREARKKKKQKQIGFKKKKGEMLKTLCFLLKSWKENAVNSS